MGRGIVKLLLAAIVTLGLVFAFSGCQDVLLRSILEQRVKAGDIIIDPGSYPKYVPDGVSLKGAVETDDDLDLDFEWSEDSSVGVSFKDKTDLKTKVTVKDWEPGIAAVSVMLKLTAFVSGAEVSETVKLRIYNKDLTYVTTSGGGNGSAPNAPESDVAAAVAYADSNGRSGVAIAEGTYTITSSPVVSLNVPAGISLFGGFSEKDYGRDPDLYETTLQSTSTTGGIAVNVLSGGGNSDIIDSLTIVGGGTDGAAQASIAINIYRTILLNNCGLQGGTGIGATYGIYVEASPLITYNTIYGGSGDADSYGIYSEIGGSALIIGNKIHGGSGGHSVGVYLNGSGGKIRNNSISGGNSTAHSAGIRVESTSIPVRNNTINGGENNGATKYGIYIGDGSQGKYANNIIYCGGTGGYGIYESTADADPSNVNANDVFACSAGLYFDEGLAALNDVLSGNFVDDAGAPVAILSSPAGQYNVEELPGFVSINDLHLTVSSPVEVTEGGIDGSVIWNFTLDKDGITRTGDGSSGWSMGAYEYDS